MTGGPIQQDSIALSHTSAYHPTPKSCISCIFLLAHTTHSLLAMDFVTSIFFPVSPATEDIEDPVPVDREGSSSNPYGYCVVA
ncbi:hypothetical protein BDV93DRAFT_517077 [Ceratobasidium sp. AG-I]|nr:hypothetical protein BDV93DRAFT_517077 [Ceratobasidium sp. AG-I]